MGAGGATGQGGFVPVADGVLVRTSRRERTTTTLVLGADGAGGGGPSSRPALLVDPAWAPDELVAIAAELRAVGARVAAGFATHAHHDHLLWHPQLGRAVPRWASSPAAQVARTGRDRLLAELAADERRHGEAYPRGVLELAARVEPVPDPVRGVPDPDGVLPGTELVVHDGHAPGHAALWVPDRGVLVVGDMLSDLELPLPCDEITGRTGVGTYLAGLDRLAPYVARARVLVPGHGTPTTRPREPLERLDADRRYLDAVLAQEPVDDPRLGRHGTAAAHARLRRVVAGEEPG